MNDMNRWREQRETSERRADEVCAWRERMAWAGGVETPPATKLWLQRQQEQALDNHLRNDEHNQP